MVRFVFFFNDTATTEIYTLSLHDALPISTAGALRGLCVQCRLRSARKLRPAQGTWRPPEFTSTSRSEEHTSELQSQSNLVCRLLLEKKKKEWDLTTKNEQIRTPKKMTSAP